MLVTSLVESSTANDSADAVQVGEDSLSRADLRTAALRLAGALPDGGPIAVLATPSLDTVIAVVAGLLAGVPVVPVPPDAGSTEVAHIVRDSGATAWIGPAREGATLPTLALDGATTPLQRPATTDPEATALILYTSGTTGAPKGVELSSRAIAAGLDGLAGAWNWTADDTLVHGLPLFHTHGLILGVLGPLRFGARLRHTVRPTPQAYAATRGSMYFGVPTVWGRIAGDPSAARALAHARLLVSGSAPLPVQVFEQLAAQAGQAPIERYGMTETMITVSTRAAGERRPGWVGLPIHGVEARIRSEETGESVPADGQSIGALEVRGATLFSGYLGRADATREAWTDDGWFRTGDIALADGAGFHRIVGRASTDLIKSGGYRIGSGEIEAVLLDHPAVAEVAVVGAPDDDLGQRIVAYVVPESPVPVGRTGALSAELTTYVAERLSHHKRPRDVVFLDALPRNAMGKVQKKLL